MVHTQYKIHKLRIGNEGGLKPWEYEAISTSPDYDKFNPAGRGATSRYDTIDALAKELATFPGVTGAEFIPYVDHPRISLGGEWVITQNAIVSDEELGQLAVLVLKYAKEYLPEQLEGKKVGNNYCPHPLGFMAK